MSLFLVPLAKWVFGVPVLSRCIYHGIGVVSGGHFPNCTCAVALEIWRKIFWKLSAPRARNLPPPSPHPSLTNTAVVSSPLCLLVITHVLLEVPVFIGIIMFSDPSSDSRNTFSFPSKKQSMKASCQYDFSPGSFCGDKKAQIIQIWRNARVGRIRIRPEPATKDRWYEDLQVRVQDITHILWTKQREK